MASSNKHSDPVRDERKENKVPWFTNGKFRLKLYDSYILSTLHATLQTYAIEIENLEIVQGSNFEVIVSSKIKGQNSC